jgi:tetratricopeptide (TPR) repeat protein
MKSIQKVFSRNFRSYTSKAHFIEIFKTSANLTDRIDAASDLADLQCDEGDYVAARDTWNDAYVLAVNAKNDRGILKSALGLGVVLFALEDYDNSLGVYQFAYSKAKTSGNSEQIYDSLLGQANCHQALNDFEKSKKVYKMAIRVAPNDRSKVVAYDNMATVYVLLNKFDMAVKYSRIAIKLARSDAPYLLKSVLYNFGCLVLESDPKKALQYFDEALDLAKQENDIDMIHMILTKKDQIKSNTNKQ